MNKKQWILSLIAAVLFCLGLVIMRFVSLFSLPPVPGLSSTPTESTDITEPLTEPPSQSETTLPPTEPLTEPVSESEPVEVTTPLPSYDTTLPSELGLSAAYAFVYNMDAGKLVYAGGDPNAKLAPASLTKLLTAYTAEQFMDMDMEDVAYQISQKFWLCDFVVSGYLGLWNGRPRINNTLFGSFRKALDACLSSADDVVISYDNWGIYVKAMHHDGTNCFTISPIKANYTLSEEVVDRFDPTTHKRYIQRINDLWE